ncbi:Transmembrane 9 superfamily member [Entamoeba marina]
MDIDNDEMTHTLTHHLIPIILLFIIDCILFLRLIKSFNQNDSPLQTYQHLSGDALRKPKSSYFLLLLVTFGIPICTYCLFLLFITIFQLSTSILPVYFVAIVCTTPLTTYFITIIAKQWNINTKLCFLITCIPHIILLFTIPVTFSFILLCCIIPLELLLLSFGYYVGIHSTPIPQKSIPRPIDNTSWCYQHIIQPLLISFCLFISQLFTNFEILGKTFTTFIHFNQLHSIASLISISLSGILLIQISILTTFIKLKKENYNWCWSAWANGGFVGFFFLLANLFIYFFTENGTIPSFHTSTINSVFSQNQSTSFISTYILPPLGFCLMNGAISFYSSFIFVIILYKPQKMNISI